MKVHPGGLAVAGGFGLMWGQQRSWSNITDFDEFSGLGSGWSTRESVNVVEDTNGNAYINFSANASLLFIKNGNLYSGLQNTFKQLTCFFDPLSGQSVQVFDKEDGPDGNPPVRDVE